MITTIINEEYLLQSVLGKKLFFEVARDLPLIDYHNHLNPSDLAINKKFNNIAEAWVLHDPYKHRAMRICGVPEKGITGDAGDKDKFFNWAKTLPKTIGNPLHLWSAMELNAVFGIDEPLNDKNAEEIWEICNHKLQQDDFRALDILKKFKAEVLCTSDDLLDDLEPHHEATANQDIDVFPSLRGDSMMVFDLPVFKNWFEKLVSQTSIKIKNLEDYQSAIIEKLSHFEKAGCRLADHSLDGGFQFASPSRSRAYSAFDAWLKDKKLDAEDIIQLKNYLLHFLGQEYAKRGWILQLHIGAQRFTSSRLRKLAGPSGGYGAIGNSCDISGLVGFLDGLEKCDALPKLILYTLNPADNEALASITGSFAEDGVPGKIQFGPAWWYNDHYHGIKRHLVNLVSYGILSQFVGMTTDSRSVFSFSRHEYFRRVLCEQIAEWVDEGIMPNDEALLVSLIKDICYYNSKKWIFNE